MIQEGKDSHYKIFWFGNDEEGILSEEWIEKASGINRVLGHIIRIKLAIDSKIITVLSLCSSSRLGQRN